jgi:uncharacterized membrane protein YczE
VRGGLSARLASLVFGLFVCALGIVLLLRAELGLAPWDVLHQGIAETTPLSFGAANVAVGVLVLLASWRLGARIGLGTAANAVLIGAFAELLLVTETVPDPAGGGIPLRTGYVLAGVLGFGVGSAFYIGAAMGAGPRDSLMLVAAARLRTRVGLTRAAIELSALGVGAVLGGDLGLGTLAFALLVGPAVEASFAVLRRSPLALPASVRAYDASLERGTPDHAGSLAVDLHSRATVCRERC